jgi:hypothetical protein
MQDWIIGVRVIDICEIPVISVITEITGIIDLGQDEKHFIVRLRNWGMRILYILHVGWCLSLPDFPAQAKVR